MGGANATTWRSLARGLPLLSLRSKRLSGDATALELRASGHATPLWHLERRGLEGRWFDVHLVLLLRSDSTSSINLAIDGRPLLVRRPLPGTAWDLRHDWSFGAVASTHAFTDRHAVADVRGSCGDGANADVAFAPMPDGWHAPPAVSGEPASFRYYSAPRLSAADPSLGHTSGGSVVRITGSGLEHGVEYSCGFGREAIYWTAAVWDADVRAVECASAARPAPSMVELRVALNGQQLSSEYLNFTYLAPRISSVAPASGPVDGGTMIRVDGVGLQLGADVPLARCAFGDAQQTAATWSAADATLRCVAHRHRRCRRRARPHSHPRARPPPGASLQLCRQTWPPASACHSRSR